jgi:hypothetical protein
MGEGLLQSATSVHDPPRGYVREEAIWPSLIRVVSRKEEPALLALALGGLLSC